MALKLKPWQLLFATVLIALIVVGLVYFQNAEQTASNSSGTPGLETESNHKKGGIVRIGVTSPPELSDQTDGGNVLRSLVSPSLFIKVPNGEWRTSLVQPKSDKLADDQMSVVFQLRENLRWSDGVLIGVQDLRRTMDRQFVDSVNGSDSGEITVRFQRPMKEWRFLWSSIEPPYPALSGGPYVVSSVESGLQTVLVPNSNWWGSAFLDEVHLVLVSEVAVGRDLLQRGELDVFSPIEDTVRTPQLKNLNGVSVDLANSTDKWTGLLINPQKFSLQERQAIIKAFPRAQFINSLLANEAILSGELPPSGDASLSGKKIIFTMNSEQPLATLFERSFDRSVESTGASVSTRSGSASQVRKWVSEGDYEVAFITFSSWTNEFSSIDSSLAIVADAGDAEPLIAKLRDQVLLLSLWKPFTVVAYRDSAIAGIKANGYANSVAWNVEQWRVAH